jgi:hypothetical protein
VVAQLACACEEDGEEGEQDAGEEVADGEAGAGGAGYAWGGGIWRGLPRMTWHPGFGERYTVQ